MAIVLYNMAGSLGKVRGLALGRADREVAALDEVARRRGPVAAIRPLRQLRRVLCSGEWSVMGLLEVRRPHCGPPGRQALATWPVPGSWTPEPRQSGDMRTATGSTG